MFNCIDVIEKLIILIYEIEGFYRAGDGDDWLPAIMRAQNNWNASSNIGDRYKGFTLLFGPREYKFSNSIQIIRGISLIGSGGAGWYAGTVLRFSTNVHGIICNREETSPANSPGLGDWSILERCRIEGSGGTNGMAHGIVMNARMTLRDVYITAFSGNDIHIVADHTFTLPALCILAIPRGGIIIGDILASTIGGLYFVAISTIILLFALYHHIVICSHFIFVFIAGIW
jgi:hypothetical protein